MRQLMDYLLERCKATDRSVTRIPHWRWVLVSWVVMASASLFDCQLHGQDGSSDTALSKLQGSEVQSIVAAIDALTKEELSQPEIAAQLTLLLNDQRSIPGSFMNRETVSRRAWFRMLELPPSAVPEILRNLESLKEDDFRGIAFEIISRIGNEDRDAYLQVLPYCNKKDVYLRSRALAALSAVGSDSRETVQDVGRHLRDSEPLLRWEALEALEVGNRKDYCEGLLPEIIAMLDDDSDVYVAISDHASYPTKLTGRVAKFLAKTGLTSWEAIVKLMALTEPEHEPNVRIWAAAAICKFVRIGNRPEKLQLIAELMLECTDGDSFGNESAEAIAVLGPRALPLLNDLLRAKTETCSIIRIGLPEAFFAVDPANAVKHSLSLTEDPDDLVKASAIQAFGDRKITDPAVIEAYIRALSDHEDWKYEPATSAVQAIVKVGPAAKSAAPALEKLLEDPKLPKNLRQDIETSLASVRAP
ncbi:MAG: HEAT repeat domain-containing protein [Planctomycetes bacterium]|nr:HEAT repeat domain-containing protein [Planctomycetota bacterium]